MTRVKEDFQDDGHLGFMLGTISTNFDLVVVLILPTKFQVNQEEKLKMDFQDGWGCHLGF